MAGRHVQHSTAGVGTVRSTYLGTALARRCSSSDGASTSGRDRSLEPAARFPRRQRGVQCSVTAPRRQQDSVQQPEFDQHFIQLRASTTRLCDPEILTLEAGELSTVNQEASQCPEDVFRCSGCSAEACQVIHAPCFIQLAVKSSHDSVACA